MCQEGQCQFGLGDCLGNWLVSCAGEHLPGQEAHLAFATCLMAHPHLLQSYNFTSIASTAMKVSYFPTKYFFFVTAERLACLYVTQMTSMYQIFTCNIE